MAVGYPLGKLHGNTSDVGAHIKNDPIIRKIKKFFTDNIALKVAKRLVNKQNEFKQYKLVERMFIILPFMHSEDIKDCEMSVTLIQQIIEYAEERHIDEVVKQLSGLKKSAEQFLMILKVFKRFPHRN